MGILPAICRISRIFAKVFPNFKMYVYTLNCYNNCNKSVTVAAVNHAFKESIKSTSLNWRPINLSLFFDPAAKICAIYVGKTLVQLNFSLMHTLFASELRTLLKRVKITDTHYFVLVKFFVFSKINQCVCMYINNLKTLCPSIKFFF